MQTPIIDPPRASPSSPSAETLAFLARPHRLCIGGERREGRGERVIEVENPAGEEIIARIRCASQADVDDAVAAARAAFEAGAWPRMTGRERGRILFRFADLLEERAPLIAEVMTLDNGSPNSRRWWVNSSPNCGSRPAARRALSTCCTASARRPARRSPSTRASTRSASPGRPRSASASSPRPPAT